MPIGLLTWGRKEETRAALLSQKEHPKTLPKPQKATRASFCAERGMDELLLISATEASPPGLVLLFISSLMRENISQMPFSSFVLLATLAILPALFWFWFYFVYLARSGKEIQKTALGLFAVGIIVSAAAYV